jgi:hypothetical protein
MTSLHNHFGVSTTRKPIRLFTLLDIVNHYCAVQMSLLLEQVSAFRRTLKEIKSARGGGVAVTPAQLSKFYAIVRTATECCVAVGFIEAPKRFGRSEDTSSSSEGDPDLSTVIAALKDVKESIYDEMRKRHFLVVALDRAVYLEGPPKVFPFETSFQDSTFWGTGGHGKIPGAVADIKAAGNCLAAECNTAAVFHAMRVAEHGIRVLAKRLKVGLTHNGKPMPIEFATWEKVLTQIKNRISTALQMQRNSKRQRVLAHYSDLADRCTYMKDLWRNDVMHTRANFNRLEAAGILHHVRDFIQSVDKKV